MPICRAGGTVLTPGPLSTHVERGSLSEAGEHEAHSPG